MAQYADLREYDIQKIAGKYGLKVISYESIRQGAANTNYWLNTDCGKHILTVFEAAPIRVARMREVLLLLEKHEFPAPRFQNMVNGEALAKYRGKPVLIRPYITGQVMEDLDNDQVRQVGMALARLHEIPAPEDLPRQHLYIAETYSKVMGQELDLGYKKWMEQRCDFLMKNIPGNLPVGLGHGDLFTDNVLFEAGKFKAFLDFENACQTSKAFDLGMAVVGICFREEEIVIRKARALVNGYQGVGLLKKSEKDSLQMCIEYAAILTSAWRFWKYNMDAPNVEKSNNHIQMVNIAKNVSAISGEDFKSAIFV